MVQCEEVQEDFHFNNMDLPGPSTSRRKEAQEPSPARPEEPTKLMKYTEQEGYIRMTKSWPPGLVYRKDPLKMKGTIMSLGIITLPQQNSYHQTEQDKAHGPFLPGENSKSSDPYGEEPFPLNDPFMGKTLWDWRYLQYT